MYRNKAEFFRGWLRASYRKENLGFMNPFGNLSLSSFRVTFVIYCLLFFGLTLPFWLLGNVIAPHRQYIEIGAADSHKELYVENRKFSDYTNFYIPEISQNLKGEHSGWLTLWTNLNELGRPTYQIAGFSAAYFPSWIIAQFTNNPWQFITAFSLFTCFLTGIFIILFCRENSLAPLAGLMAGSSLAASPLFMYWSAFPMFSATFCWSAGALWGVTRLVKKQDLLGWSVLAFAIYSLLIVARKQAVVYNAYILTGFGLYLTYQKIRFGWSHTAKFVALSASALLLGTALALPVIIDLVNLAAESGRVAPNISFFTTTLPALGSLAETLRFFVLSTTPELLGNPVETSYPFPYNGLSITSLVMFFAVLGLLTSFKKNWGWWLAIFICCLFALIHPLYEFGIKHFGFNLSRGNPMGSIILPLTIIFAYGVDALVKRSLPGELSCSVRVATACVLAVIAIGLGFGLSQAAPIRWGALLAMFILSALLAAQYKKTRPALLIAALVIVLAMTSYPLVLRQDPAQIAMTSPLVERVRAILPVDSRFAVAAPGLPVLPPNLNAVLGLASVHSYNSLSSRRYHALINALGGKVQTYGRWNGSISPDYNSAVFWMSNISLVLSPTKLNHENLVYLGEESGVHLYKVISRMGECLQFTPPPGSIDSDDIQVADPRLLPNHTPSKTLDRGDLLEFDVTSDAPSVLVLSQKFHRDWQAQVFNQSGWVPAKTTVVNGVFQGILLPQGVQRLRLEFKPYVRYAWVAHAFWLLLLALLGFKAWRRKQTSGGEGVTTT
jgi:hypothetical protein